MVRRISPSQFRSRVRQLQSKARSAEAKMRSAQRRAEANRRTALARLRGPIRPRPEQPPRGGASCGRPGHVGARMRP